MTDMSLPVADRTRHVVWISIGVTIALWVIPGGGVLGYPLLLLSTYVHEMGHGLAALMIGGGFDELQVFGDGSGVAFTRSGGGSLSRAWISAGGLIGPAVAAAIGFVLGRTPSRARIGLLAISALTVLATLIWVRSLVGFAVAVVLAGTSIAVVVVVKREPWPQLWLLFLSIQLALSVFSRGEYLFASSAATGIGVGQSDSAAIADALIGPYWFWGAIVGLFSVAVLAAGAWTILKPRSPDA